MSPCLEVAIRPLAPGQDYIHEKGQVVWRLNERGVHHAGDPFGVDASGFESEELGSDFGPANALFNALQDAPVADRTLLEHVWWHGESMWQFVPAEIWADVFRALETIRCLDRLVAASGSRALLVHPARDWSEPLWAGCCTAYAQARGLDLQLISTPVRDWRESRFARCVLRPAWRTLRRRGRDTENETAFTSEHEASRRLRATLGEIPTIEPGPRGTLLFLGNRAHWRTRPDAPGTKYDNQLYPLLPALREAGWQRFVAVDCFTHDERLMRDRAEHMEPGVAWRGGFEYVPRDYDRVRARSAFARQFRILRECPRFDAAFRYEGVRLWPGLEHRLRFAFERRLPEADHLRALACEIIRQEKPEAVIATGETSPVPRAILVEAKRAGIPSLGLQHGNMFENHYNYMHRRIRPAGRDEGLGFTVPTRFCTWGPFWRRNLTDHGHWPPGCVVDTGLWQLDSLHGEARHRIREATRERYGVEPSDRLVLVIASKLEVVDYVRRTLAVLRRRGDSRYLVRVHPQDDPIPVSRMLAEEGYPGGILSDDNTHVLLAASDVVVSQLTTVISEAMYFDRPVVLVDYQGMDGWGYYQHNPACLQARTAAELSQALDKLDDPETLRELSEARAGVSADLFLCDDGGAARRVAQQLNELLEDSMPTSLEGRG